MVVFLAPGEVYFTGDTDTSIRTLLGSCVAVTLWHPRFHAGGMCHVAMPDRAVVKDRPLDGRYASEAIELLMQGVRAIHTQPKDYVARLFGGARMISTTEKSIWDIGARNIESVKKWLSHYGFNISQEDLSGTVYRHITLDVASGNVICRLGDEKGVDNTAVVAKKGTA